MKPTTPSKPRPAVDELENLFKALADKTRLRILALLGNNEVCVCHIHDSLGLPQPTVSRHLAYLRKSGLVATRRDGVWMHYQVSRSLSPVIQGVVSAAVDALKLLAVLICRRKLLQGAHRSSHNALNDRAERSRYLVVHPDAVPPGLDEPALPQIGEMPRNRRLRNSQAVVDVTHADLVASDEGKDPQPRLVGQRLEQVLQLVDCRLAFRGCRCALHIFVLTNVSHRAYIR